MDERLRARLRTVDDPAAPRPEFVERLHDTLAARLGLPLRADSRTGEVPATRAGRPWLLLAASIAAGIALVGGGVLVGAVIDRSILRPTLLDTLRLQGTIRVAVRPDHPQVLVGGGALGGFDIEVARRIGMHLELDSELAVMTAGDMLGPGTAGWDVALPSTMLPADSIRLFHHTAPYYYWPLYVLVPRDSSASQMSDLEGTAVCVVAASSGEAWLTRATNLPGPEVLVQAPANAQVRSQHDDNACLAEVQRGDSAAMVTNTLAESDLASRPDYRVLGGAPVGYETRAVIVDADAGDTSSLLAALNEAIAEMRADGTLSTLSRRSFGGQDLSVPPH